MYLGSGLGQGIECGHIDVFCFTSLAKRFDFALGT